MSDHNVPTYVLTDDDHPCTLVLFRPDTYAESVQFGNRERSADEYQYDEPPEWFAPIFKGGLIFARNKWVSTDGWRGHSDWDISPGWVSVAGGWVTGYPDSSVSHKVVASDIYEQMFTKTPEFPVVWIFGPSSNVFSTISDVYVQEGREDDWTAYLETLGTDEDTFADAFR